ncbi:STAS domain-containing protein [Sutcliffiella deserti]|uniref:STAS domain-containing protein n=1 Tax=Sutcliffiella deserti TaxID=2875501 RepID=UPI001CC0FF03|nr:STAS domain-containing protein [Sutcliffiella deserti]
MQSHYNQTTTDFSSLKIASKKIFKSISERLDVNTAYVTRKGKTAMTVLSSYNEKEQIIPEGYAVEYGETYCKLIITNEENVMHTENLAKDLITSELEVTSHLEVKGFLGVTLTDVYGNVFGTLCVMDKEEKEFSEADIAYLKSMAEVLSHLIELDETKYNMAYLNVPIVPITKGVSILTIQGVIDFHRAEKILDTVLNYGADHQIHHFILDLSGLVIVDEVFPTVLTDLVNSLQLMGIKTILTGITPEIAKYEAGHGQLSEVTSKKVRNLESALEYIGFSIEEKE